MSWQRNEISGPMTKSIFITVEETTKISFLLWFPLPPRNQRGRLTWINAPAVGCIARKNTEFGAPPFYRK